ncbi:hypothetical protein KR222_003776 [Zaprionus bogoriensis]|nr:hypothetical protein KR222_003776 [Zaprionus bogoriensis]
MAKNKIIVISCAIAGALVLLPLLLLLDRGPARASTSPTDASKLTTSTSAAAALERQPDAAGAGNSSRQQLLLLHRSKRYLLFPEGSSFQLVFDLIIPIVDYTNFAILGVTCAVAWELPSKPPSELVENLRTRLNDGTLGTVRRNGSAEQPDSADANWQPEHAASTSTSTSTDATNDQRYAYYTNVQRGGSTSAYANSPNGDGPTNWHARQSMAKWRHWASTSPPAQPPPARGSATGQWSDNWWQRNKARVQQNWREKQQRWNAFAYPQRPRQLLQEPPRHHIFPVFGKRRRRRHLDRDDDIVERLHLRQHLSSRALLFGKIERLYRSRQLNGTACIQRALCESAQRQQAAEQELSSQPQSFIMEILSAIFQLPSSEEASEHIAPHYLEAHRMRRNCRQLYGDCSHNFWFE